MNETNAARRRVREQLYRADASQLVAVGDRVLRTFDDARLAPYCGIERSPGPARGRKPETENSQLPVILQTHLAYFVRLALLACRDLDRPRYHAGQLMRRWGAWSGMPHKTTVSRGYRLPKDLIDGSILANLRDVAHATIPLPSQMSTMMVSPLRFGPNGERVVGEGFEVPLASPWVTLTGPVPPAINANV